LSFVESGGIPFPIRLPDEEEAPITKNAKRSEGRKVGEMAGHRPSVTVSCFSADDATAV